MDGRRTILGIDAGSVSVTMVEVARDDGKLLESAYALHHGDAVGTLKRMMARTDLSCAGAVAATTSTPRRLKADFFCDNRVALVEGAAFLCPRPGAVLVVGGERFGVVRFDEEGGYRDFRGNTSCAAGTGSFLDQQARRLGLKDAEELGKLACENRGTVPRIASRCAVFARTDLVHAQQQGYGKEAICDGLCLGLARNIHDALFAGRELRGPVAFTGGVAANPAVVRHLEALLRTGKLVVDPGNVCQALGAARSLLREGPPRPRRLSSEALFHPPPRRGKPFHGPLRLQGSSYPDFSSLLRYEYRSARFADLPPVEVDLYRKPASPGSDSAILGMDIGSTSTKAALVDSGGDILAGFYTRTSGRPVEAGQLLLEAMEDLLGREAPELSMAGAATTGSGRKLLGSILGADLVVDEITAHARAAAELDPLVDTVIEIGGQDSKFTAIEKGRVTFCAMNAVCAAGTGSFIEEQAEKLACPLDEYSGRAEGHRAPMASDRCTVFMERDLNHYLREGFETGEVLACVARSVCENYLTRVADEGLVGSRVVFQGATARNRALVAAFEERLGRAVHVSKFCHLAGAAGAAMILADEAPQETRFRGLDLCRASIPVATETCELCPNHCKITTARVRGRTEAFGFLCGRDYDAPRRPQSSSAFSLVKEWKRHFTRPPGKDASGGPVAGLPEALYLKEDAGFWRVFFDELGIPVVASGDLEEGLREGRKVAGAEFCAPLTALYGHVLHLLDRADFVFLPAYLERREKGKGRRRQYCYYSQYAPALVAQTVPPQDRSRIASPLVHYLYSPFHARMQIYRSLNEVPGLKVRFAQVSDALSKARQWKAERLRRWKALYGRETDGGRDIHAVLLGRPYTVLSPSMNKGVPELFASLDIKALHQSMLSYGPEDTARIRPLLDEVHWLYAARILEAAEVTARTPGAYPVLVTSFHCSPDAFVVEYFKRLMRDHDKPYLVLQLDDHGSSVGYETRIEAAVRAFRSHRREEAAPRPRPLPPGPRPLRRDELDGRTLLLPNWDELSLPLVAAALRKEGIDARVLPQSFESMRKGLRRNTGQCIPLNCIAQEFVDYVKQEGLDPSRTALWTISSSLSCNLGLFAHHLKHLLRQEGNGFEKAAVHAGELSFKDISLRLPMAVYLAFMFGGYLRRMACHVRPYEKRKGETDRVVEGSLETLLEAFRRGTSRREAVDRVVEDFKSIRVDRDGNRPQVAVFGDLYARDNETFNQNLIRTIEEHGGEAVTTPYTLYLKMIAGAYLRKWLVEGHYANVLSSEAMLVLFNRMDRKFRGKFAEVLGRDEPVVHASARRILAPYGTRLEHTGESMENLLKIHYLLEEYPDLALLVQTSPAFCCPSLVTEAMGRRIEALTGLPVVSITYDGTGGDKNEGLIPYLKFPRKRRAPLAERARCAGSSGC